jgi:hypothetical protein
MVYPNKKSTVNNEESFEQSKEKLENDSLEAKRPYTSLGMNKSPF